MCFSSALLCRFTSGNSKKWSFAVVGSVIDAGGLAAKKLLLKNDSTTQQPMNTTQNLSKQTDFDGIDFLICCKMYTLEMKIFN